MKRQIWNLAFSLLFWISGSFPAEAQGTRIDFNNIPKSGTVLIYAHQDDDLIWMLPFWKITEKFIGGAMPATPNFRTIVSQQQTFLNSNGYNISYQSNWLTPWDDISNNEYSYYYWNDDPNYSYLVLDHLETRLATNKTPMSTYEINKIKAKIEQYIASPSVSRVITHNNWGEYGHQHHRALNKAVRELAVKYRKDVWMLGCTIWNYIFNDIAVPNGITYTMGSFNTPDLFTGIRTIYRNNNRWTWYVDQVPSGNHPFIKIVDGGSDKSYILRGDAITYPGPSQLEPGAYIFDGNDDYLTLKGNNNSSFTITMRIRPDQIRAMDIASMSEYPLSTKNDRNLYITSDGHITARIFDGSSKAVTSNSIIPAGAWTHVAITGNGSSLKLYVNGLLDKTISSGRAITNYSTPEFILGQATLTSSYFKGQINNVGFYDYALSDSEISQMLGKGFSIYASAGTGGTITPSGNIPVKAGSEISFNIRANSGYEIANVVIDNYPYGAISSYKFSNISDYHSIVASFRRTAYSITSEAGTGGSINPAGVVEVNYGGNQTFTIKPDVGYRISSMKVDNVVINPVSEYSFRSVTSNHSISATFTPLTYSITSNAGPGGMINPLGTTNLKYGNDQTFTVTPDKGYQIKDVLVDNRSVGAVSRYTFSNVVSDHSISASFIPLFYTVQSITGSGGFINPSGNVKVNYGKDAHFAIIPDEGYRVSSIMVDYLPAEISSGSFSISNITRNHILTVAFAKLRTFTIVAGSGRNGSIHPSGDTLVTEGADQSYVITPSPGYRISNVFIDTISIGPVQEFTFRNISGDHTISVVFTTTVKPEIYPNPFRDEFTLILRSPFDYQYKVSLVNLNNRIVFMDPGVSANTELIIKPAIPPGMYVLNVYLKGKKVTSARVVKY